MMMIYKTLLFAALIAPTSGAATGVRRAQEDLTLGDLFLQATKSVNATRTRSSDSTINAEVDADSVISLGAALNQACVKHGYIESESNSGDAATQNYNIVCRVSVEGATYGEAYTELRDLVVASKPTTISYQMSSYDNGDNYNLAQRKGFEVLFHEATTLEEVMLIASSWQNTMYSSPTTGSVTVYLNSPYVEPFMTDDEVAEENETVSVARVEDGGM